MALRLIGSRPPLLRGKQAERSLPEGTPAVARCSAASVTDATVQTPATRQAPYWIGNSGPISQAINAAISTPAIWSVLRIGARNAMTSSAEKSGIPWKQTVAELQACKELETLRTHIVDPNFAYPEYAERKFHAYNGGNLDWQAVWEIEPATASLAVRVFKNDKLEPEEALSTMRQSFTQGVQMHEATLTASEHGSACSKNSHRGKALHDLDASRAKLQECLHDDLGHASG